MPYISDSLMILNVKYCIMMFSVFAHEFCHSKTRDYKHGHRLRNEFKPQPHDPNHNMGCTIEEIHRYFNIKSSKFRMFDVKIPKRIK